MNEINLNINGRAACVPRGTTILEAAAALSIDIPTLCYLGQLAPDGSCRLCVVEVGGRLVTACSTQVREGMTVLTESPSVISAHKLVLELLLARHRQECFSCAKNGQCKLQEYCYRYNIRESSFPRELPAARPDVSNRFFMYDPGKCILCRRCIRTCAELQGKNILAQANRGEHAEMATAFRLPWEQTDCENCGNCVSNCPTGALLPKTRERFQRCEVGRVRTVCGYCGVGCGLTLLTKNNRVVGVDKAEGGQNDGLNCVKGKFAYHFINHPDRLQTPLIRRDGELVSATWDEALDMIAQRIQQVKEGHGAGAIAGFASARATNEDNFAFMKLMRGAVGTNHIDHCARVCHSSTVSGLAITLGSGAMTNSIAEIAENDVIFVIGANPTEAHPVIGSMLRRAKANGAKLIVADPREIDLAKRADIFLQLNPGTNVALVNGMMSVILAEGLEDRDYIDRRTEGFEQLRELAALYTPELAADICGIDAERLKAAARLYAGGKHAAIYYTLGVTEHTTGTDGVMSLSNLALLCGNIGKRGGGINPLRGQNNVQGACDMGCLPDKLSGYQNVADPAARKKFADAWHTQIPDTPGLTVTEILDKTDSGEIKLLYVMGENLMLAEPDINHVERALKHCEFLVVQDLFRTETAELADVVLPACSFAEKDGTFTNTGRCVQRVRKAVDPVGESKPDYEIFTLLMEHLGFPNESRTAEDFSREIAALTPSYGGISFERLEQGGLCWPCPTADHPGTPTLHLGRFACGERAKFVPCPYRPSAEMPGEEYPFVLTTGRMLYHYHTRTMTGKTDALNELAGYGYIEVHPNDAAALGVWENHVVQVTSRRGTLMTRVRLCPGILPGVVYMPFHFADSPANLLTNTALDPISKIPEIKVCAVRIESVKETVIV